MPIQVIGYNNSAVAEVDGTVYRSLRTTSRPPDYGLLGSYRVALASGTMAAGQGTAFDLFQARWIDATRIALIWGASVDGLSGSATVFTAGFGNVSAFVARNWTDDGTGGATVNFTGDNQQMRSTMRTSLMGTVRMSTTTALGIGTRTLDSQAIGQITFSVGVTGNVMYVPMGTTLIENLQGVGSGSAQQPLVLSQNEGLVIQGTIPATGTWQVGLSMAWSELASF